MELVVAITENNVIGLDGDMPWHLPADLKHFKDLTSGHAVLMGRKTYDSIGKPLPNRLNLVITRSSEFKADGVTVVRSVDEAIAIAKDTQLFVIGGSEIYALAMEYVKVMHVTRIHASIEGDTFFPTLNASDWNLLSTENRPSDEKNPIELTFEEWAHSTS
ncbi:MAG: dihydrofolate reductase [Planctomycetota bacterium]|nr:dihydrofolate reductase [Planctomycetota bacterium]